MKADSEALAASTDKVIAIGAVDQLWRHKLGVLAMDVEADIVRTVTVPVETGAVLVSSPGRGKWEL